MPGDRRATIVQLTDKGRASFAEMASVHEGWINELLGDFSKTDAMSITGQLDVLVDKLRPRVVQADGGKVR